MTLTITFTAMTTVGNNHKRRKLNYVPFSLGLVGKKSSRTRKHKVRKTKKSSPSSTTLSQSLTTFTMGKRIYSSLSMLESNECVTFTEPPLHFSNKKLKFTMVEELEKLAAGELLVSVGELFTIIESETESVEVEESEMETESVEVEESIIESETESVEVEESEMETESVEVEESEMETVVFDSFGDDSEDDENTTPETHNDVVLPPIILNSTNDNMGSVMVNNVRRSARIIANNTVPMGSIFVNGLRRSSRLMLSR